MHVGIYISLSYSFSLYPSAACISSRRNVYSHSHQNSLLMHMNSSLCMFHTNSDVGAWALHVYVQGEYVKLGYSKIMVTILMPMSSPLLQTLLFFVASWWSPLNSQFCKPTVLDPSLHISAVKHQQAKPKHRNSCIVTAPIFVFIRIYEAQEAILMGWWLMYRWIPCRICYTRYTRLKGNLMQWQRLVCDSAGMAYCSVGGCVPQVTLHCTCAQGSLRNPSIRLKKLHQQLAAR